MRFNYDYPVTEEQRKQILDAQGGKCAICRAEKSRRRGDTCPRLAVDHDHKTGKVRGLLCSHCNLGLGNFRDNKRFLRRAIGYLHEAVAETQVVDAMTAQGGTTDLPALGS